MVHQQNLIVATRGRGTYDITREIHDVVEHAGIVTGLCSVFVHHTSASLILCENADPSVRADLEMIMQRIAPDGDPAYRHHLEGPDDMPAHIRSILTSSSLCLPVTAGRLALGTWQGVFLWEHRTSGHRRQLTVTLCGE